MVSPSLLNQRAAYMRQFPSPAEAALWRVLSGSKLGVAFKRQVVIEHFIVDLLAPSLRLIVEVDGSQHLSPAMQEKDARRDRRLHYLGYSVLRVEASLVFEDVSVIVERIRGVVG